MTASQLRHKATGCKSIENLSSLKCRKNDCGTFHADLYDLAMHEELCKGGPPSDRETLYRFSLTADAANGATPSVIIINRSSKAPPQCWKDGTASVKEGLPQLGRKYLAHYAAWNGYPGGPAVLHSCYEAVTRYIPAPAYDNSFLGDTKVATMSLFLFVCAFMHTLVVYIVYVDMSVSTGILASTSRVLSGVTYET